MPAGRGLHLESASLPFGSISYGRFLALVRITCSPGRTLLCFALLQRLAGERGNRGISTYYVGLLHALTYAMPQVDAAGPIRLDLDVEPLA